MSCDLDVDTDQIRRAVLVLDEAARDLITQPAGGRAGSLADDTIGDSAVGRQALRLAVTTVTQGAESADILGRYTRWLMDSLTRSADLFEQAEAMCRLGR